MILLLLLAVALIVISTTLLKLHPFLALLLAALFYGLTVGMSTETLLKAVSDGFGGTLGSVGLVIIIGVIIGTFLEKSGGVYVLADKILGLIGPKRIVEAMAMIGYIVSIPVFCDSGFVILSSLNRALSKRAAISLSATAVALGVGLMATHSLVPPTPGPIATAGIIGADLGLVIFWGFIVSLLAMIPCLTFAKKIAPKIWIDPNLGDETVSLKNTNQAERPGWTLTLLPILVPILLIVAKSFNSYLELLPQGALLSVVDFVGTPVIALCIGLGFAVLLPRRLDKEIFSANGWVGEAIKDSASIIMITGAGGIFGSVLKQSGLADLIGNHMADLNLGIWLPFLISAALKTAQGSSTVAMITTASLIAPLIPELGFETNLSRALAVLAIGAGATVISHVNDSFFWVVTQLSGMNIVQGYKLHSAGTGLLGFSAAIIIYIISFWA